ncbi:MAG TPA: hypothetical protein VNF68_02890 [Candidatus Baltobacteraceae bacterium]|nr:hypothetical protein [Candidatus Baltobacteraceae bacterium]
MVFSFKDALAGAAAACYECRDREVVLTGEDGRVTLSVTQVRGLASMRGFMFSRPSDRSFFFPGVDAIHMAFVPAPLDVWFLRLDRGAYVVLERRRVAPWQYAHVRGANGILETWPGRIELPFSRLEFT